jgi:hypothetical protein
MASGEILSYSAPALEDLGEIYTPCCTGNKADVSSNDLLAYWAEDPRTDVIVLYGERCPDPGRSGTLWALA